MAAESLTSSKESVLSRQRVQDDEFLRNRGIRDTEKDCMTPQMKGAQVNEIDPFGGNSMSFSVFDEKGEPVTDAIIFLKRPTDQQPTDEWIVTSGTTPSLIALEKERSSGKFEEECQLALASLLENPHIPDDEAFRRQLAEMLAASHLRLDRQKGHPERSNLSSFLDIRRENSVLRRVDDEGAIRPLGTQGEGRLKHLQLLATYPEFAKDLKHHLQLLGWFGDLELPTEADEMRGRLRIRDRWLSEDVPVFDQRSANEGFLYLLF